MRHLLAARIQVPTLGPGLVLAVTILFVVLSFVVGADWVSSGPPGTVSELLLDNSFGLARWGGLIIFGCVCFFTALASRRHIAVWAAHAFLASIYFGISITVTQSVLDYGGGAGNLAPPLAGMCWHLFLTHQMRAIPRAAPGGAFHGQHAH